MHCKWKITFSVLILLVFAKSVSAPAEEQNELVFPTYDNYSLIGTELQFYTYVDLQSCVANCHTNNKCLGFSFDKWAHHCSLKATMDSLRFEPSAIAGVRGSLPKMSDASWEMLRSRGRGFKASSYRSEVMSSFEQCELTCESDQGCVGFSFLRKHETCRLFRTIDTYYADQESDSGIKHQREDVAVGEAPAPSSNTANIADDEFRDANRICADDALRFCSDFVPDAAKINKCMINNRAKLSLACQKALAGLRH
jgi:hypothetical protein